METIVSGRTRRSFITTIGLGAGALAFSNTPSIAKANFSEKKIKLGIDNFSVRAMKWKAAALIDYAASLKTDSLFITDLDAFESFEEKHLAALREKAADKGLQIHLGTWSICPSSKAFRKTWGTAEEHLTLAIRVAHALGSPVARVVLGNMEDRRSPGGIEAR